MLQQRQLPGSGSLSKRLYVNDIALLPNGAGAEKFRLANHLEDGRQNLPKRAAHHRGLREQFGQNNFVRQG